MKGVKIEIEKAADDTEDGDAVIRLLDVFELPDKPVFRIDPLDDRALRDDAAAWPAGDLTAAKMRVGEKGVELIVTADSIDWPALLPGTPVAVSVPSASIREELRWPSLALLRGARRGIVVVSAEKRRAEIAARAKARRAELESLAAVRLAAEAEDVSDLDDVDNAPAVAVGEGLSRLDVKRKGKMMLVASSDDEKGPTPTEAQVPSAHPVRAPHHQADAPPGPAKSEDDTRMSPTISVASPPISVAARLAPPPPPHTPLEHSPPPAQGHGRVELPLPDFYPSKVGPPSPPVSRAAAQKPLSAAPPPLPANMSAAPPGRAVMAAGPLHTLPATSPKFLTREEEHARSPYTFQRAFGMGFLVAAVLALLSTFALRGGSDMAGLLSTGGQQHAVTQVVEQPATLNTLSAILAVPDVSSRGEQATSVDLAGALKRADQSLSGTTGDDKEEAKYWLRRALASGLGDQRLVWALTQLGTIYAAPAAGAPDYASARVLWELAAAQGDPIALCFLASLHEHGLGVAKDEVRALVLYRNAKTHGGCRNVDQSIARLTQGTP